MPVSQLSNRTLYALVEWVSSEAKRRVSALFRSDIPSLLPKIRFQVGISGKCCPGVIVGSECLRTDTGSLPSYATYTGRILDEGDFPGQSGASFSLIGLNSTLLWISTLLVSILAALGTFVWVGAHHSNSNFVTISHLISVSTDVLRYWRHWFENSSLHK